jgi:hypothetical protein
MWDHLRAIVATSDYGGQSIPKSETIVMFHDLAFSS